VPVAIGNDEVTVSLPRTRVIHVVEVTTGWGAWLACCTSALFLRWRMVDEQSRTPVAVVRAWRGKV
jgi:hypothetical protein